MSWLFIVLLFLLSLGNRAGAQPRFLDEGKGPVLGIVRHYADILAAPSPEAPSADAVEKFSFVFLFGPESIADSVSNEFYAIGKTPEKPAGWVPRRAVMEWRGRKCLGFTDDKERDPALAYRRLDEALGEDWGAARQPNFRAIAQEAAATAGFAPFYPVLDEAWIRKKGAFTGFQTLYQVAYLASFDTVAASFIDSIQPAGILKALSYSGLPAEGIHFDTGWITEKNTAGRVQSEPYLYLHFEEFNLLLLYLQASIAAIQSTDVHLPEVLAKKIAQAAGTGYSADMNLGKHLQERLGLAEGSIDILDFGLAGIPAWSEERKAKASKGLKEAKGLLEDFMSNASYWAGVPGTRSRCAFLPLRYLQY